jgi:hypothetical protein
MGPTKVTCVIRQNRIKYFGPCFNKLNITMLDFSLPSWCKWDIEGLIIAILGQ